MTIETTGNRPLPAEPRNRPTRYINDSHTSPERPRGVGGIVGSGPISIKPNGLIVPDLANAKRSVIVTLLVGLVVLLAFGALALGQAPPRLVRIGAPGTKAITEFGANPIEETIGNVKACQTGEVLAAGVSAVRVSLWGFFGARVHLTVQKGSRVLAEGSHSGDWTSDSVTIPIRPVGRTYTGVKVCVAIGPNSEPILLLGTAVPASQAAVVVGAGNVGTPTRGRLAIEYLAPGQGSWWSRILTVARHLGLGRAYSGTWIALLLALLMATVGVLAVRLTLKELQ